MTGLAGWVDLENGTGAGRAVAERMSQSLRHRGAGPGIWSDRRAVLVQRGPAGPATLDTPDGPVTAVFAGHVQNAPELRRRLQDDGTRPPRSDAELVLRAYLRWGPDLPERLDGAWTFAVWDGRCGELLLGRDRMGVKPLYLHHAGPLAVFGSEPKAVLAHPAFTARLRLQALPILLQPRLTLPGETPLDGLAELPGGHVARFGAAGLRTRRYWQLTSRPHEEDFAGTAAHVRSLLDDVVSRQLPAGPPVAAMLSGGVDSTSVAAIAAGVLRKEDPAHLLDTYCLRFASDGDHFVSTELRPDVDAPFAQLAADELGTRHHTVTATVDDLVAAVPATRRARDLPSWGQFDASMYLLFERMRAGADVALSGEAADELFGGYPYLFKPEVTGRSGFAWLGTGARLTDHLAADVRREIDPVGDERARYEQLVAQVPRLPGESPAEARMREVLFLGMAGPLAVVLDRKERMSAAVGLEVRIPFCDHRLVEYVWNVPWRLKCRGGVKGLLKAAMADVLPVATAERRKSAYPHVQNPDHERALVDAAERVLHDATSPVAALFDRASTEGLLARIRADDVAGLPGGTSGAQLLIQLVELDHWIRDHDVQLT